MVNYKINGDTLLDLKIGQTWTANDGSWKFKITQLQRGCVVGINLNSGNEAAMYYHELFNDFERKEL